MQIDDYIKLEQTKAIYDNTKILVVGIAVVTLVTVFVFWSKAPKEYLLIWLFAACLIIMGRLLSIRAFRKRVVRSADSQFWLMMSAFWSFVTGLHWGIVPAYFLPSDATIFTIFVSIVYTGHLAGAISTNSAFSFGFLSVGIPTTTLFAGRFFYEGGQFYNTVGLLVLFYFAVSLALSRNSEKLFREARELTYKNMQLTEELLVQKDAAELATRTKDRFLAAASHDLRQPLHSSGLLLSALDKYVHEPEGKSLLSDIRASSKALNHSFNSLLDVSRLDAGVVTAHHKHLEIMSLIEPIARDGRIRAEQNGLTFQVAGDQAIVISDPVLLERILNNLVSNALSYTKSGEVKLSWNHIQNQRLRVLVSDSGIGIPSDHINEIFSEYYQVNNPERDRDKGFGLGLAIVDRLCKILRVDLYVSSTLKGGTTFALYLPIGDRSQVQSAETVSRQITSLAGVQVLVIDDDASVRKSMKSLLTTWGCNVSCADSNAEAIEHIVHGSGMPEIIIADYRLRDDVTGVDVLENIFDEINDTLPAIIITGDTSPDRLRNINSSGYPVLHKPVAASALRSAIQSQLLRSS